MFKMGVWSWNCQDILSSSIFPERLSWTPAVCAMVWGRTQKGEGVLLSSDCSRLPSGLIWHGAKPHQRASWRLLRTLAFYFVRKTKAVGADKMPDYSETSVWDWTKCCLISMQCPCRSLERKATEAAGGVDGREPGEKQNYLSLCCVVKYHTVECPHLQYRVLSSNVLWPRPCSRICEAIILPASWISAHKLGFLSSYNSLCVSPTLPLSSDLTSSGLLKDFTPDIFTSFSCTINFPSLLNHSHQHKF